MYKVLILLVFLLPGCTYFIAKETVKTIDEVLETSPNPEKKKKILENKKKKQNKAKELVEFLYANLKRQPVTKTKIKLLFKVFEIGWKEELKKVKNVKKNLS